MPAATPASQRQQVFDLHLAGLGAGPIARRLSLPPRTIRHLLAQWRPLAAGADLSPRFGRCGRTLSQPRQAVLEDCLQLRREHSGWGAGRIRLSLLSSHDEEHVPPARTLQRWLLNAGLVPPPAVVVSAPDDRRAREPHEVHQMDAVEGLRLLDGSGACWLRHTDECSGAILATAVFPPLPLGRGAGGGGPRGDAALLRSLGLPATSSRG